MEVTSTQPALAEFAADPSLPVGLPARASASFEGVYREHFRFVWRTVRRLGVIDAFVDDLVQEIFLVVHRRLGEFEGRSSVKTWLYGIVRRVISDHRRSLRRRPSAGGDEGDAAARLTDVAATTPLESAERAEQVRLLYRALEELDDDKREAFILAEFEQMTMAEIAEALDVNPNTISSRLRAARIEFGEAVQRMTANDATTWRTR